MVACDGNCEQCIATRFRRQGEIASAAAAKHGPHGLGIDPATIGMDMGAVRRNRLGLRKNVPMPAVTTLEVLKPAFAAAQTESYNVWGRGLKVNKTTWNSNTPSSRLCPESLADSAAEMGNHQ
jgi:hypothetical protein